MKILLVGDGGSGKKEFREKYLGRGFQSKYMMTIGADYALKDTTIDERPIRFQIWDLAGQQRFDAVRSVFYRGALGAIVIFDVTKKQSFKNCASWVKEIWTNNGKGIIPIVLVGTNIDQREQHRNSISDENAQRYIDRLSEQTLKHGFEVVYYPVNLKTGLNIVKAFETLGRIYIQYVRKKRKSETSY